MNKIEVGKMSYFAENLDDAEINLSEVDNSVQYNEPTKQKNVKIQKYIRRANKNIRNYPDHDDYEEINLGEIDEYLDTDYEELETLMNKI